MITTLALDIESRNDCNYFVVTDRSYYNNNLPITCSLLEIKTPGNCNSVYFNVLPGFNTSYNASILKIQQASSYETLTPLPDGIYYIKYSIDPADQLYVEYNYLHNCAQYSEYISKSCELLSAKCDLTKKQFDEKLKDLETIKQLIDSSKYLVEYCNKPEEGVALYNDIKDQLNKFKVYGKCNNC